MRVLMRKVTLKSSRLGKISVGVRLWKKDKGQCLGNSHLGIENVRRSE